MSRVSRIAQSAEIRASRVAMFRGHATDDVFKPTEWTARTEFGVQLQSRGEVDGVGIATFLVALRAMSADLEIGPDQFALLVEIHRLVTYSGIPGDATEADLRAFAQSTVTFNTWPLLRSDMFDFSSKLGVTPILLPLHRMSARPLGSGEAPGPARDSSRRRTPTKRGEG